MIKVIFVDNDPLVLKGLSLIVSAHEDIESAGTAHNGEDAVRLCRRERPDVSILDIRMPGTDGIDTAARIIEEDLSTPLLLTTFDEPELIKRALDVGAGGYILKTSPSDVIIAAIRTAAGGGTVFSPDIIDHIKNMTDRPSGDFFAHLTRREKEVVELIAAGMSNRQIAEKLYLSDGTVRNYISLILEKTNLDHRTQIAVKYYRR